ncbi:hypothetical protein N9O24_00475 [bacterium]|nr:hypothetical protein [bacterium]
MLLVSPSGVSAHSFLNFDRGSAVYGGAKVMMGYFVKVWHKFYPSIAFVSLWPKYSVKTSATSASLGANPFLQAPEHSLLLASYSGEASALALARPTTGGRVDAYLDEDIFSAMESDNLRDF